VQTTGFQLKLTQRLWKVLLLAPAEAVPEEDVEWVLELGKPYLPPVRRRRRTRPASSYLCPILEVLKTFSSNRCLRLLREIARLGRELRKERKDRPYPFDFFDNPERVRGLVFRADFQGAGALFHRKLQAGEVPHLVQQQEPAGEVAEEVRTEEPVANTSTVEEFEASASASAKPL